MPIEAATLIGTTTASRPVPRLVVPGSSGFIGSMVVSAAKDRLPVLPQGRRLGVDVKLSPGDVVIGCAIHPLHRTEAYDRAYDLEREFAEAAARAGARFIMLSSRRVYPENSRWGASETDPATGDDTAYGKNKARTEGHVLDALGDHACILRLSNVFGFEYQAGGPARASFFGLMLSRLKTCDEIYLDIAQETRRDFIPAEWVAEAVVQAALSGASGIMNVGAGEPIACGAVAQQVISGYGRGRIRCAEGVRDEFYLDTSRWVREFGANDGVPAILEAARQQGLNLKNA